jgi:methylmalonyl-CoA mutase cobalamin-binding domain/chain
MLRGRRAQSQPGSRVSPAAAQLRFRSPHAIGGAGPGPVRAVCSEVSPQEVEVKVNLAEAMAEMRRDDVLQEVERRAKQGEDPVAIINDCRDGMVVIGDRFAAGDYYLAELLMAGELFREAAALLDPYAKAKSEGQSVRGVVVMATPKGDIHDLGKNIVVMMLKAYGFEVHDLGVDVDPKVIVAKVAELKPQFLGLSVLLTTGLASCKEVVDLLAAQGLRDGCRLILGGGVTTAMAKDRIGADFQTTDVMEGIEYCVTATATAT